MNSLDSSLAVSDQTSRYRWWPILFCIFVLMVATISPPEKFHGNQYGSQSILPPAIIKLIKLAARGSSLMVLSYCLWKASGKVEFQRSFRRMIPIFAFGVFGILSVAWSAEKSISLVQAVSFFVLLLLALLVSFQWKGDEDTSQILKFTSLLLAGISLSLIVLHFALPRVGALTRNSSGLFHSTMGGATASLALVTLICCRLIWGWNWTKKLLLPGTAIHVACMLIGANRLSLAVAVLVCGIAFFLISDLTSIAMAVFAVAVLAIGYLCVDPGLRFSDTILAKFEQFTAQGQTQSQLGNFSGRSEMWEKIWDSYLQSPLIGHGYFVTSPTARIYVWGEWGNWTAHNSFLQLLVTLGVVGLVLFTIGIGSIAWPVLKKLGNQDRSQHRLALLLTFIGMWFLGWGTLNESIFGPLGPESVVFALMLGFGVALANQDSNMNDDEASGGRLGASA